MSQINLLPWRLEHKKMRNRVFYGIFLSYILLSFLFLLSMHGLIKVWQYTEHANIGYLRSEIQNTLATVKEIANLKSQQEELTKGMEVICTLQDARFSLVYLLDTVVRITPAGLWLTEFSRCENQIALQGVADTNASISELLRNLEQQKRFANIKLSEIKHHKKQLGLFFKIELEYAALDDGECG